MGADGLQRIIAVLTLALLLALGPPRPAAADALPEADSVPLVDRFAPPTAPELDEGDRSRLATGEVVVRDLPPSDPDGIGVLVVGLVDAVPDRVWAVMSDCEDQDEFLPRISHASVRDRDGDSHTCDLVVDLPFPLEDLRTATRQHVRRLPDGGYQRRWELAPGDWSYQRYHGSWTVHPYLGGRQSLVAMRMDALPKSVLPAWFLRAAQTRQAPETFDAIRERVRTTSATGRHAHE